MKRFEVCGIKLREYYLFHDSKGEKRGSIIIYVFEIDGLKICHLSDLGHLLSKAQIEEIGKVDVLLTPVGGTFTIDAEGAVAVVEQLSPKLVIPMHYKTPAVSMPIDPVDDFTEKIGQGRQLDSTSIDITKEDLGDEMQVVILNYE